MTAFSIRYRQGIGHSRFDDAYTRQAKISYDKGELSLISRTIMKTKRKNQAKQRRIGLLLHTALFFFGSAFYMVWWAANTSNFPQLVGFLLTWFMILLLHTISVPIFKRAKLSQSLWWRPKTYRGRHFGLDVNVAFFMATVGVLDAWVISQMLTPASITVVMNTAFGLMLILLPLWAIGVLYHGHRVLVQDVGSEKETQTNRHLGRLDDVSGIVDNLPLEEAEQPLQQASH